MTTAMKKISNIAAEMNANTPSYRSSQVTLLFKMYKRSISPPNTVNNSPIGHVHISILIINDDETFRRYKSGLFIAMSLVNDRARYVNEACNRTVLRSVDFTSNDR